MGRPIEIGAIQSLIPILSAPSRGYVEVAPGSLDASVKPFGHPGVETRTIAPGFGPVNVVKKLIEPGDLSRLNRLIGDQRRLDRLKSGKA
jgi:hypothetical protein